MKQHLESAAIALGIGVLGYIAYRSMKKPSTATAAPSALSPNAYLNPDMYYDAQGNHTSAGILDARDAMAWGGRQIGSVA